MSESGEREIAALIEAQPPRSSLLQPFYRDPVLFRRDIERIFLRHWLCVGHVSGFRAAGDFKTVEIAGESAIILRGEDGDLRAFVNVCRHRGSRICAEESGRTASLICPYHGWTYGLDGKLEAARHMPGDFDLASHGLRRLHLRVIEGLILMSLAEAPLSLDNAEATLQTCLGPFDWARARVAHRERYPIAANWKLAVENYLECYHCAPAHPEYSRLHALEQPPARIERMNQQLRMRAAALGTDAPTRNHWKSSDSGEEAVFGFRYPLYEGVETGSEDGRRVAPLMGNLRGHDGGATSVHFGPASFFLAYADHGVIYRFLPRAVDRTEIEVIWLVREDARSGADFDPAKLTWLWRVTSEADQRIIEQNQLGVASRYYAPGPYAPMEANTSRYVAWYLHEISSPTQNEAR
ncbi:MAG TPA: aromatic ring-hydroxylating dioxygenase subunit alpha [Stellaceae bacterium]|nr:aromatic ring-hydroxylating dioxygenase subunit alpha [Stellaceae bacterium]